MRTVAITVGSLFGAILGFAAAYLVTFAGFFVYNEIFPRSESDLWNNEGGAVILALMLLIPALTIIGATVGGLLSRNRFDATRERA